MTHELPIGSIGAALAVSIPVAVYLAAGWLVTDSGRSWSAFAPVAVAIVLVLAATWLAAMSLPLAVLAIGVIVAAVVAVTASCRARGLSPAAGPAGSPSSAHPS